VEFALFQNVNGVLQRPGQVRTGPDVGVGVEEDAVPERRRRGEQFALGEAGIRTAADRVEDDGSIARDRSPSGRSASLWRRTDAAWTRRTGVRDPNWLAPKSSGFSVAHVPPFRQLL